MDQTITPSRELLIAHIADVHLRDTQYAAKTRGDDFFAAFMSAINACIRRGVDLIVCAGDNFDVSRPSAQSIGRIIMADRLLAESGMRMLTITGNHDMTTPTWLQILFPGRDEKSVGIIPMDGRTLEISGYSFTGITHRSHRQFRESLGGIQLVADVSDVLIYHGMIAGVVPFFTKPDVVHVDEFPVSARTKAILLGDIHVRGYITKGSVLVGYPGSLEMCNADESTEKGVTVIKLTQSGAVVHEFMKIPTRRFIYRCITEQHELDALIPELQAAHDEFPVVLIEYAQGLPQTISRVYAALDPHRSVIRCHPLPVTGKALLGAADESADGERFDLDHFVAQRLKDQPSELAALAADIIVLGEVDINSKLTEYIELRKKQLSVRDDQEEDPDEMANESETANPAGAGIASAAPAAGVATAIVPTWTPPAALPPS